MQTDSNEMTAIARRYERFGASEARGSSLIYEQLAFAVAGSSRLLTFLRCLPSNRRQPNLFLAAVRHVSGVPRDGKEMEEIVRTHGAHIREVILSRTTQTNEPARCAVLLPVLADLDPPLALIEVGASAGLCLLPDRYGYDYGTKRLNRRCWVLPLLQSSSARGTPRRHSRARCPRWVGGAAWT
jgi:hypothetical protein